jgi:prepilin-type N-terminal cleavage/methylation domain-containing protein
MAKGKGGFSLVEVIVAMMVLTIGLLGLAAGTGWMIRSVHFGELETNRSTALQSAVETVRATPYQLLEDGSDTFGNYTVEWTLGGGDALSRNVRFIITGPGRVPAPEGGMPTAAANVVDTVTFRIIRRD